MSPSFFFFSFSAFLQDFSLCQDRLSGDASELGTALLCSSRAGYVYVAVSRNSLYDTPNVIAINYYVWKQQYVFPFEAHIIGSSGIWTHDLLMVRPTRCHLRYRTSFLPSFFIITHFFNKTRILTKLRW